MYNILSISNVLQVFKLLSTPTIDSFSFFMSVKCRVKKPELNVYMSNLMKRISNVTI
jgi:hypothetical protein